MEGLSSEINQINYIDELTEDQKLATLTCPNFTKLQEKALSKFYERVSCSNCPVMAKYDPNIRELKVKDSCPDL